MIDTLKELSPEKQDRVAAVVQAMLRQPPITSNEVRPEVMDAFEQVMSNSSNVLDYLHDK